MADANRELAEEQGLGPVESTIALRGALAVPDGKKASPELCLCERGLLVVAARSRARGVCLDLLARDDVKYEPGRFGDHLRVGAERFGVPAGKGDDVQRAIAVARLRRAAGGARPPLLDDARFIDKADAAQRAWLAGGLEPDEIVLALLGTTSQRAVASSLLDDAVGALSILLTERRALGVAISSVGDVRVEPLPSAALRVDAQTIRAGDVFWTATRKGAARFAALSKLFALDPLDRLREAARLEYGERRRKASLATSRRWLGEAARRGDTLASFAAFLVAADQDEPPSDVSAGLAGQDAGALANLFNDWGVAPRAGSALLVELERRGDAAEPWALELHVAVHAAASKLRRDPLDAARADIALAQHLLARGDKKRARSLLELRLASLPSEAIDDLLPPRDADLTEGAGGQALRIRVYELLAQARTDDAGKTDPGALAELARLQPLVIPRIQALADAAEGELQARARTVLSVLEPGGLGARTSDEPAAHARALPRALVQGALRHPLLREGGALLGDLQTLIASVPTPDTSAIRDYCERLSIERHGDIGRALTDAARVLGVDRVEAYVSRGDKSIGLRAYEASPPFVLVGGRHLEPGELSMSPRELAFALGAEVAHLRYGHSRATSSEVWAGAVDKGRQGLDVALGILPALRSLRLVQQARGVASRLPAGTVKKVVSGAVGAARNRADGGPRSELIGPVNEELVAAHRVMQLTADRAGLLLCGDLASAVRAMLLVRRDYRAELARAEAAGIEPVLARRSDDGRILFQDLAVRVAALIAFYLSDDWPRLRSALVGEPA